MQGSNGDKDIENRLMNTSEGEEGEGEMYGESNMESYITICKIDSQQEFAHDSGNSSRGSVTPYKGGMGREIGGRLKRRGHIYTYG